MIVCSESIDQGKKRVASVAVASASIKDYYYRVNLFADGHAVCTCKGYKYRRCACRHIKLVRDRLSDILPAVCIWTDASSIPQNTPGVCPECGGQTKDAWTAPRFVQNPI